MIPPPMITTSARDGMVISLAPIERPPDRFRRRRHIEIEAVERIDDRIHYRRWRSDAADLGNAFHSQRIVHGGDVGGVKLESAEVAGPGQAVVHERAG